MTRLTFGLALTARSSETLASFDALAAWLRDRAGLDLTSLPSSSYEQLVRSIREGSADIAWLPPVAYSWLAEAVTPIGSLVRGRTTTYCSALVVRDASEIVDLAGLASVRAGWVDPWSAAGFVVPRLELAKKGIVPSIAFRAESFYGSHREALLALGRDACDVVGTYARTPVGSEPATEGAWSEIEGLEVRVLTTFAAIPPDVIAVRRNLGPREYELTVDAFRAVTADADARTLMRAVFDSDALHEGLDAGHEVLRRAYERAVARGLFD